MSRRIEVNRDGVLIAAEGTGSCGAVLSDVLQQAGYRVVEAPTPHRARARSKTDALDAMLAARSSLVMPLTTFRDRRSGELQSALRVLTGARDQQNADRLRCINALTALVRTHDLGIGARRARTGTQIATIASWRHREEKLGAATARTEATRLAKRITTLESDLAENREQLTRIEETIAPE